MTFRRIQKVLVYAAVFAGAVAATITFPLARDALAERQRQREDLRYASGLYPCGVYWDEFSKYIDGHLTDLPDISVDVFPTFSDAEALRVVGQEIYYFRFKGRKVTQHTVERADSQRSALSKETSTALLASLTNEIVNARSHEPLGLDGTIYIFRTSRTNRCAAAWSPGNNTRALDVVKIYHSAVSYTTNSAQHPVSDIQLRSQIAALVDR